MEFLNCHLRKMTFSSSSSALASDGIRNRLYPELIEDEIRQKKEFGLNGIMPKAEFIIFGKQSYRKTESYRNMI